MTAGWPLRASRRPNELVVHWELFAKDAPALGRFYANCSGGTLSRSERTAWIRRTELWAKGGTAPCPLAAGGRRRRLEGRRGDPCSFTERGR